ESSHVLLFGVSAEGALTENSGRERYDSPLRRDKRPIDGIFTPVLSRRACISPCTDCSRAAP
ncbi:MAG TPA: hypothetical protein VIF65_06725, partial [Methyloceanibacter sp.]